MEPIRLEYSAPEECGDSARFYRALRLRTTQFREAGPNESARRFTVEIVLQKEDAIARLSIREPTGEESVREIVADGCDPAIDGVALIAALAIDPRASSAPAKETDETPAVPAPSAAPPADRPPSAIPGAKSDTWSLHGAIGAYALWAVAPSPLFGEQVNVEAAHALAGSRWLVPSVLLSAEHAGRGGFAEQGGTAQFSFNAASLRICPVRAELPGTIELRPCLAADFGAVTASGAETLNPRSSTQTWLGLGGGGRIAWPCCQKWSLVAEADFTFPLQRERFLFGPYAFHEVPVLVGAAALGISMRFL